jgi:cephalosporin hydroxylase
MLEYDPHARLLTFDPADPSAGVDPLQDWNYYEMDQFCPFPLCRRANETAVWQAAVTYVHALPTLASSIAVAREMAAACEAAGHPVMVIEDSDHSAEHVLANVRAYAEFVSPGSFLIVQDTRFGRGVGLGPSKAIAHFLAESGPTAAEGRARFVRDRRPEYLIFSQHSGGFLRRLREDEAPGAWDELEV